MEWWKVTRKMDYNIGSILIIIDDHFHDYTIGTKVKVISFDNNSYHVVNIASDYYEKRFWWVKENQVELWK